jgi:glycosyltransferase involved in cell wall biosynthesis
VKGLFPNARLLRVGGAFTAEQLKLAEKLKLRESILVLPRIDRNVLAAVYRRAALVLQPSEREGFGLPVVEAMACGTPVVASDLPVLQEVGGDAAEYCKVGDIEGWTETIEELLREREKDDVAWQARRDAGLRQSGSFTWAEYARKMVTVYEAVLSC